MILHDTFAATPLDRTSLPQGNLDIAERVRTNPLPWTGQFSPQLVEKLLTAYAPRNGVVLDPFVGSGTSLVEAARLDLPACGGDLNPAAVALARVYRLVNLDATERAALLHGLRESLFEAIGLPCGPLFVGETRQPADRTALESALVVLWRESSPGPAQALMAALVVLCDFYREHLDAETIHKTWRRLERIVRALPESARPIAVHHADARALPVESGSADLVLTSPPYINVHNYHQKYRRSVEALEWDVLAVARSEIGSNRQNRGNRFLTVVQYSLDMALALREMARVARRGSRLILVLGRESSVRGTRFFNGELVTEVAVQGVGLEIERRQERVFRNRYGADIYEDILHFRTTNEAPDDDACLTAARHIAGQILSASRGFVPSAERPGLEDAMARLDEIAPSPMRLPRRSSRRPVADDLSDPTRRQAPGARRERQAACE